jgi:hypothetical protein
VQYKVHLIYRDSQGRVTRTENFVAQDLLPVASLSLKLRQDFAILPAIEGQNRTLAQVTQRGVHPPRHAPFTRRCAAFGAGLRGALQQRASEQRHRIHHAEGHARRASGGDSGRAGSEAGGGAETAADSSPAGRVTDENGLLPVCRRGLSRWRGGRYACYAPHLMPKARAFNCDFCLSPILSKPCKINRLRTKKDSIPIAIRSALAVSPHPPQPPAASF